MQRICGHENRGKREKNFADDVITRGGKEKRILPLKSIPLTRQSPCSPSVPLLPAFLLPTMHQLSFSVSVSPILSVSSVAVTVFPATTVLLSLSLAQTYTHTQSLIDHIFLFPKS